MTSDLHLEVDTSDQSLKMKGNDNDAQHWLLSQVSDGGTSKTSIGRVPSATAASGTITGLMSVTPAATGPASGTVTGTGLAGTSPTASPIPSGKKDLSTGAIAGIAVGVGLVGIIVAAVLVYCCCGCRGHKRRTKISHIDAAAHG
jgi:hypothetical protein